MSKVVKSTVKFYVKSLGKPSGLDIKQRDWWSKFLFETRVKLSVNKWPLLTTLFFWFIGFLMYASNWSQSSPRDRQSLIHAALVAAGIRGADSDSDLSNLYQMAWPIFVEVIVFGFISTTFLGHLNAEMLCGLHARHTKKHTVVIGYKHLGERIVDFLQKSNTPYVVIDTEAQFVSPLLKSSEPVVIGDITQLSTLKAANVQSATEVFLLINKLQEAVLCCCNIRFLNSRCPVYVQVFQDEDFDTHFSDELNVIPFSTSKWAREVVGEWVNASPMKWTNVLILGSGKLASRFAFFLARDLKIDVYVSDFQIDPTMFSGESKIRCCKLSSANIMALKKEVDLHAISNVIICWNSKDLFSNTLFLTMRLRSEFPKINVHVRCFDEMFADILSRFHVQTFSTSNHAFEMLRRFCVEENSAIFKRHDGSDRRRSDFTKLIDNIKLE